MGRLTDILNGGTADFNATWNSTEEAGDFGPLPKGVYMCHATKGELESSRTNRTPGFKVEFTVIEGEHKGRKLWLDLWLTTAALPASKRDLAKLGINSLPQMELLLPRWLRCKVTAVVRRGDDGIERNEVRNFDVLGIDKPEADPFAPPGVSDAGPPVREPGVVQCRRQLGRTRLSCRPGARVVARIRARLGVVPQRNATANRVRTESLQDDTECCYTSDID